MRDSRTAADSLLATVRTHPVFVRAAEALHNTTLVERRPLVVAMSGGSDSTALALVVAAWCDPGHDDAILAYFDHEQDPVRHAAEWHHVGNLARELGIRSIRATLGAYADIGGRGPEERWRNCRYAFLRDLAGVKGVILTGHTMDDVAETFVMSAMRGGSGSAMAGPRAVSQGIIRPLLGIRRDALRDLLRLTGVGWIEDPSNAGDRPRAWIRTHLLPAVTRRFGRESIEGFARSARVVEEWSDAVEAYAGEAAVSCIRGAPGETLLDLACLAEYPRAVRRRVLTIALTAHGLPPGARVSAPVEALMRLLERTGSGRIELPGGLQAVRSCNLLRIAAPAAVKAEAGAVLPLPGRASVGGWIITASLGWFGGGWEGRPRSPAVAMLDRDTVCEPLQVRTRRHGDRMVPMGMDGAVRLKKYLRDHGVPRWARWSVPLVCDAVGRILWLPGIVRGRSAPIDATTRRVILLKGMPVMPREERCGA